MRRDRPGPQPTIPNAATAALVAVLVSVLGAGCRRPVRAAPAHAALEEDYCWWTVFRTLLPADTVAARFARAFTTAGLTGARWSRLADTAWAAAGATVLAARGGRAYAARVVAYRRGDSTHFRHFVALAEPAPGLVADPVNASARRIVFCADIGRAARVGGTAPRESDGEEQRAVWQRRP